MRAIVVLGVASIAGLLGCCYYAWRTQRLIDRKRRESRYGPDRWSAYGLEGTDFEEWAREMEQV